MKTGNDFLEALREAHACREGLEWAEGYVEAHAGYSAYEIQSAIPFANWAYWVARNIAGADIAELQRVVLERGEAWVAYLYALDIPGADIAELQRVVVARGEARWMKKFMALVRRRNHEN